MKEIQTAIREKTDGDCCLYDTERAHDDGERCDKDGRRHHKKGGILISVVKKMELKEQKALMRTKMRRECKAMDAQTRNALSEAACARLVMLSAFREAECILAYMAMPHECDPARAVEAGWRSGKRIVFPVCEENFALGLYLPSGGDAFVQGKYGIWEPDIRRSVRVDPEKLDCVIVPGIAFDKAGGRLGQGAGYYDRLLTGIKAFRIGLCFPMQITELVPTDKYDCKMDAIVSAGQYFFT